MKLLKKEATVYSVFFNSKPTKIKARVKAGVGSVDDEFSKLEAKEKKSIDDTIKSEIKAESKKEVVKETEKAVKKETAPKADNSKVSATQAVNASEEDLEEKANNNEPRPVLSNEEIESRIRTFLGDMFSAMDIPVEVKITFDTEEECVNVELIGENMGLLIGKRGQTLDSIQYLTSLVLNKGKEKYVRIKVDTENYRQRRKDTLESLAKNIAYKVKRSRRSVALEPMNPYERRIIHSALQGISSYLQRVKVKNHSDTSLYILTERRLAITDIQSTDTQITIDIQDNMF